MKLQYIIYCNFTCNALCYVSPDHIFCSLSSKLKKAKDLKIFRVVRLNKFQYLEQQIIRWQFIFLNLNTDKKIKHLKHAISMNSKKVFSEYGNFPCFQINKFSLCLIHGKICWNLDDDYCLFFYKKPIHTASEVLKVSLKIYVKFWVLIRTDHVLTSRVVDVNFKKKNEKYYHP